MSSNSLSTPKHGSTAASKEGTVKWTKNGHYVTPRGKALTPHNNNENIAIEYQKQSKSLGQLAFQMPVGRRPLSHLKAQIVGQSPTNCQFQMTSGLNKTAKNKKRNTPIRENIINNIKKEIYKKAAISNNMRNRGVEPYEPNSPAAIAAFRKNVNTAAKAAAKVLANAKAVGNTRRKPIVAPLRKRPQVAPKRETSLERNLRLVAESQTPTHNNSMSSVITKMTVPELKETLTARGLSTKGLKADLVKRLLNAIKNNAN